MRILHLISSADRTGGGPIEAVLQLSAALELQGHLSEVATLDTPGASWLTDFPLVVHPQGPARGAYCYGPHLISWLRQNAGQYDHVVVNGLWQYHGLAARSVLHRMGRPYVVYTHGMLDPWFKRTYPLKHLKKSLYWPWAEYKILRDAQAVCFTCEEERLLARQSFGLYKCNEAVVGLGTSRPTGNAVEQRETFLSRYPHLQDKRLLLFLSRLHIKKGCDLLIEAFARIAGTDPSLHLVMAGPDQTGWQAALEQQAQRLGLTNRITWTGMISGDLKWGAFSAAEAFVLPSHQENFGIAVAEALACGLPVLISNKVNIWREIQEDGAGMVGNDDLDGTTQLLTDWLKLSASEQHTMRQKATQSFLLHFEISAAARNLLQILSANNL